jgi:hypothetical protein
VRRLGAGSAAVALVGAVVLLALLLRRPLDLSRDGSLPGWLDRLIHQDAVAYPAHAGLGALLEGLRFPPEAVGLQWLKAAAHARTAGQAERLGSGLAATRQRASDPDQLDAALCRYVIGGGTHEQRAVIARARMRCEPHA